MGQPFEVEVDHLDGGATIALVGELDLDTCAELSAVEVLSSRYDLGQLTFSCERLMFVDSSGLDALIRSLRWFGPEGRPRLVEPPPTMRALLESSEAGELFVLGG